MSDTVTVTIVRDVGQGIVQKGVFSFSAAAYLAEGPTKTDAFAAFDEYAKKVCMTPQDNFAAQKQPLQNFVAKCARCREIHDLRLNCDGTIRKA
jgi:hypothetical protein